MYVWYIGFLLYCFLEYTVFLVPLLFVLVSIFNPKCVPAAKAARMTASQKESAVRRKRAAGNPGGKPTNVKTFAQDGLKIETSTNKRVTKKTV